MDISDRLISNELRTQMLDRIAAVISILMSPFLVPIASILLVVRIYAVTSQQALLWALIVILFVSVLPSLFILLLFGLGRISDMRLIVRAERMTPLFFSLVSALAGAVILHLVNAPREIVWLGIAYVINGVVFVLITPAWKISFHSGVAAGCVTALALLVNVQFAWLFLLLPLIAWARVHRKRHTVLQTVVAAILAVASTVMAIQLSL
ncbi:MAG: hypothetical protein O7E52_22100 [Candidatus Poribacteria bacterium]|nr:hypothetical protein [Candidatus Poribacteria bacterium]